MMSEQLCIMCCHNFLPEVKAVIAIEGWTDVVVAGFPSRCGHPPLSWDELRPLLPQSCTEIAMFGRACLAGLGSPPPDWPGL
jgi:hypothetical protein